MAWYDDPDHPFAGIWEKLKRADENIVNLQSELVSFFDASKYPVIPDPNAQEWQQAVDYHRSLPIPLRFNVLCGEVVHHLRSCLDHITWYFSSVQYRIEAENAIEFPVFRKEPLTKEEIGRYNRKIGGITDGNVRKIIENSQPYQRGDGAANDPLCIIHDMDRFDKHRELTIITNCVSMVFPPETSVHGIVALLKYGKGDTLSASELAAAKVAIKKNTKGAPQIAFAQFGDGESQPVVPALAQLLRAVADLVNLFANEV